MVAATQDLEGRSVLVTGASGFIGAHLARRLRVLGASVHGTSRGTELPEGTFASRTHGDLADAEFVRRLVDETRPDVVFHLASRVTGSRGAAEVLPTFQANLASTVHLLVAAHEAECRRVILAGSMEEAEASPGGSPPPPPSPYAAAKQGASDYARMFHALYRLPVVTARIFMVYGPGQRDLAKLVPYVTCALLRGERPSLSSGERPVDWIYVADVVEGLVALATASGIEGMRLDLGSGELVTVRGVAERLATLAGERAELGFGERPDRPFEAVRRANVEATRELAGWRPRVALADGLRRTWEHYREALRAGTLPGD